MILPNLASSCLSLLATDTDDELTTCRHGYWGPRWRVLVEVNNMDANLHDTSHKDASFRTFPTTRHNRVAYLGRLAKNMPEIRNQAIAWLLGHGTLKIRKWCIHTTPAHAGLGQTFAAGLDGLQHDEGLNTTIALP